MENNKIAEKVYDLAIENAIEIDEKGDFINLESFAFVSFLVSMEDEFGIAFPDTLFSFANMNNVEVITKEVSFLLEEK
jgi:acyl carrier protein